MGELRYAADEVEQIVQLTAEFVAGSIPTHTQTFLARVRCLLASECTALVRVETRRGEPEFELLSMQGGCRGAMTWKLVGRQSRPSRNHNQVPGRKLQQTDKNVSTAYPIAPVMSPLKDVPERTVQPAGQRVNRPAGLEFVSMVSEPDLQQMIASENLPENLKSDSIR